MAVFGFEWLAGNPIPSLGSLLRARRHGVKHDTTRRGRRLASHRRLDEHEIFLAHRACARNPPSGNGPVCCLHADEPTAQEGFLFMALPGWNPLRESLEAWKARIRPQSASTEMDRYSASRVEVPASCLLRITD